LRFAIADLCWRVPRSRLEVASVDAVPNILKVVCQTTGLGFAAVARVTEDRWTAMAALDQIGFGPEPGGELELATAICHGIPPSRTAVVIDSVWDDPLFKDHPTLPAYGFQSYIAMPIILRDGTFYGALCAIDPAPAKVGDPRVIKSFELFAELLGLHLENRERVMASNLALLDERRAGEMREQFIAILGHDLRNPLAALAAGSQMLDRAGLDGRSARILALMQESCRRMLDLTSDILDFARGRLGAGVPLRAKDDEGLAAALAHVVEELRTVHPATPIELEMALPSPVFCDAARLAQLLSNLLANALTHGDPDKPVRVVAHDDGAELRIEVHNHGPTIAPDRLSRLFEPFESGASGHQGLGLGLFIASEIARAHDGTLTARSAGGQTCFEARLPSRARSRAAA
jgi:signal transduction histidine kinase